MAGASMRGYLFCALLATGLVGGLPGTTWAAPTPTARPTPPRPTATATPVPPTATPTRPPATPTPVPPSATPTRARPTATATPAPTNPPATPQPEVPSPSATPPATPPAGTPGPEPAAATSSILGRVVLDADPDGQPGPQPAGVADVEVRLIGPAGELGRARTDERGRFHFDGLGPGTYRLALAPPDAFVPTSAPERVVQLENEPGEPVTFGLRRAEVAEAAPPAAEDAPPTAEPAPPDWLAFVPTDAAGHLAVMQRASARSSCGVPWQVLAAIARVESDFGRNMATSSAGAIGYGQFLPSSWGAFGDGGNAYDYRDALPAIARYLCAHGAARDLRAALFAYNHADWYVDLVLAFAARFDQLAPGAPVAAILNARLAAVPERPLRYAPGRDTAAQRQRRVLGNGLLWLGVPFLPRASASDPPSTSAAAASLGMLLAGFGKAGLIDQVPAPASGPDAGDPLAALVASAWQGGLFPMELYGERGHFKRWTADEVRRHVQQGHPVVATVGSGRLPGHGPPLPDRDTPIVIVGVTLGGLIYNDPAFASLLGYGLEISGQELDAAWEGASIPRQAVAFIRRPRPAAADAPRRRRRSPVAAPAELAASGEATALAGPEATPVATPLSEPPTPAAAATPQPPPPEAESEPLGPAAPAGLLLEASAGSEAAPPEDPRRPASGLLLLGGLWIIALIWLLRDLPRQLLGWCVGAAGGLVARAAARRP